jgi:hypothetical protein
VICDIAVERVEFCCHDAHWQSVVDYDVVLYTDADGDSWEFFSLNGIPTMSPYTLDGAEVCPVCHRLVVGHPVARRLIPVPPGEDHRPRHPVTDPAAQRSDRDTLPLLSANSTAYADPPGDPQPQGPDHDQP